MRTSREQRCIDNRIASYEAMGTLDEMVEWDDFSPAERETALREWDY